MAKDPLSRQYEVVVIGGSAGSLEVILQMLGRLTNRQLAVVIILHRKNSPESLLPEVMALRSVVSVREAEEKEPVLPGRVYLAPADYHLLVESDHTFSFDYSEKVNFSRPSIDVSFESVASAYGTRAVAILLSGGNSDGVAGLKAIKAAGGLTVVQDPGSAEISFMPESALSAGDVDLVLHTAEFASFVNGLK